MHDFVNDLRYGVRMLLKNRSFTIVTVLTLGLGPGANLTIFSFMDTLFFRPLPVHNPDQLVIVEATRAANGKLNREYAYPEYEYLRDHSQSLEALAAHYARAAGDESRSPGGVKGFLILDWRFLI